MSIKEVSKYKYDQPENVQKANIIINTAVNEFTVSLCVLHVGNGGFFPITLACKMHKC